MAARWRYSLWMLITYVCVFVIWKVWPSRIVFLAVGSVAISLLATGLIRARRAGYFANRVDLCLHAYVIIDLILETISFEAFRAFQKSAVVEEFHNNVNFIGCSLAFTVLIGGYHWFATRRTRLPDGAAYGQAQF